MFSCLCFTPRFLPSLNLSLVSRSLSLNGVLSSRGRLSLYFLIYATQERSNSRRICYHVFLALDSASPSLTAVISFHFNWSSFWLHFRGFKVATRGTFAACPVLESSQSSLYMPLASCFSSWFLLPAFLLFFHFISFPFTYVQFC